MSAMPPIATIQGYEFELTLWAISGLCALQQDAALTAFARRATAPIMGSYVVVLAHSSSAAFSDRQFS